MVYDGSLPACEDTDGLLPAPDEAGDDDFLLETSFEVEAAAFEAAVFLLDAALEDAFLEEFGEEGKMCIRDSPST